MKTPPLLLMSRDDVLSEFRVIVLNADELKRMMSEQADWKTNATTTPCQSDDDETKAFQAAISLAQRHGALVFRLSHVANFDETRAQMAAVHELQSVFVSRKLPSPMKIQAWQTRLLEVGVLAYGQPYKRQSSYHHLAFALTPALKNAVKNQNFTTVAKPRPIKPMLDKSDIYRPSAILLVSQFETEQGETFQAALLSRENLGDLLKAAQSWCNQAEHHHLKKAQWVRFAQEWLERVYGGNVDNSQMEQEIAFRKDFLVFDVLDTLHYQAIKNHALFIQLSQPLCGGTEQEQIALVCELYDLLEKGEKPDIEQAKALKQRLQLLGIKPYSNDVAAKRKNPKDIIRFINSFYLTNRELEKILHSKKD